MKVCTIDFETQGIVGNPLVNPPEPIGVSIKIDDAMSHYYTEDMKFQLDEVWHGDHALVMHNCPARREMSVPLRKPTVNRVSPVAKIGKVDQQ